MRRSLVPLFFFAVALLFAPTVSAQQDALQLKAGPMFGVGGEFGGEVESDAPGGFRAGEDIDGEPMEATLGGFINFDIPLHTYVAVGARVMYATFIEEVRADSDFERNSFLNFDLAPRFRYDIAELPLELYLTTPVGLSLQFAGEDWEEGDNMAFDTGIGWNLSVLIGADYLLSDAIGVFAETGWMYQTVNWEGKTTGSFDANISLDGSFGQFAFNLGVFLPI